MVNPHNSTSRDPVQWANPDAAQVACTNLGFGSVSLVVFALSIARNLSDLTAIMGACHRAQHLSMLTR